jgi:hypothetical protein
VTYRPAPTRDDLDDSFVPGSGVVHPSTTRRGGPNRSVLVGIGVVVVLVAGAFFALRGGGGDGDDEPRALAPQAPAAGLPAGIDAAVRIQAESARRTAMQAVMSTVGGTGAAISLERLTAEHPNLSWVGGTADSTGSTVVSFDSTPGRMTVAVGATNKMCAYGRWSPPAAPEYVTMTNTAHCRAAGAPKDGWSTEPGGAAFDLPDEDV